MARISHVAPTGDARADAVLRVVVEAFERAFPNRIRGYYLHGSQAEGDGVPTSDLDLVILFCDRLGSPDEHKRADRLRDQCAANSLIELDIELADEASLRAGMDPTLKLASRLIYGEDVREQYPLVALDAWARDRLHSSYWRIIMLFGRPLPVVTPLTYPDSSDAFYGYTRRKTRLPGGGEAPGTRDLIRSVGWAATALLALRAGVYVARKRDCHVLYRRHIGDEWSDLLEAIYTRCRGAWRYLIPDDAAAQAELRAICGRTLGFERHFLAIYHDYLLEQLRDGDEAGCQQARCVLGQVPWQDERIAAALAARDQPE